MTTEIHEEVSNKFLQLIVGHPELLQSVNDAIEILNLLDQVAAQR